jgi:hypothetical protein
MTRPTREQTEEARAYVADLVARLGRHGTTGVTLYAHDVQKIHLLLAVTAELTDEELAEEAVCRFGAAACFTCERDGYIAGARREGRR